MFVGDRCSRAVAVFVFISYRNVETGICHCRLKIVLDSVRFLLPKQQQTATIATKSKLFSRLDKVSISSSKLSQKYRQCYNIHFVGCLFTRAMTLQTRLYGSHGKPFHFTRNVSGISKRSKFCLSEKRPLSTRAVRLWL